MFGVLLSNRNSFLGEENWQEYIVAFVLAFPTQIFFPSMTHSSQTFLALNNGKSQILVG